MNRIATIFVALALAGPAACQSLPTSTPTTQTITLDAAKALYIAELAYHGLTITEEAALASGALTEAQRATVRSVDTRAYAALLLARQGRSTANAVLVVIAEAQTALAAR